jgi:hypothetical protein
LPSAGSLSATDNSRTAPEPLLQVDAAIRSAANTATFGGADKFSAAADALFAPGGFGGWRQRYDTNLRQEQARDRYDAVHRPLAQSVGSVGGGVLGLFALGPEEAVAAAPRLAGAAKLTAKEVGAILAGGGLAGLGSQKISDVATGHHSSTGDLLGAVAGGIAGAAAFPLAPTRAGAMGGAVTSAAQDLFNGRPVDVQQMAQSAMGAGLLGGHVGRAGRKWSGGLSPVAKGQLGETLGDVRAFVNGEGRIRNPTKLAPVAEGNTGASYKQRWRPDATDGPIPNDWTQPMPKMFEDKLGYGAALSKNQTLAKSLLGGKFQLNHFLPDDVGLMTGLPAAGFGPQVVSQTQGR